MEEIWEVHALKYGSRENRTRADSFIFDDDHASPHPIDYFIWVLRNGNGRTIVVDTGYDADEARRRGRPIDRDPAKALGDMGVDSGSVDTVIITHLHYDHAGGLQRYPAATFHVQAAEMAYATGPCMCEAALVMPFTAEHVCQMVQHVYGGRVVFHEGEGAIASGVTVHHTGGHSRGLQVVRVKTAEGYLCLASDASHFYENFQKRKPFPIVVDVADMLSGYDTLERLASRPELIIPGHDPLVMERFAPDHAPHIRRLA